MHIPEDLLSIPEAEALFRGRVHAHSIRRWIARGLGRPPIKLRAIRLGRNFFMSRAALDEFLTATADPEQYRRRQSTERNERAKQRLMSAGA